MSKEEAPVRTGGAYLKNKGLKGVVIGLTPAEHALVVEAAARGGKAGNLARFIAAAAVEAAEKTLGRSLNGETATPG